MLTDEDLQRELTAAFHQHADPIARTGIEPAALLRRATRTPAQARGATRGGGDGGRARGRRHPGGHGGAASARARHRGQPGRPAARGEGGHGAVCLRRGAGHAALLCRGGP